MTKRRLNWPTLAGLLALCNNNEMSVSPPRSLVQQRFLLLTRLQLSRVRVESSRACWFKSQLSAAILNATFEWKFAGYSLLLLFVLLYSARSIQLIFCGHWSILPGLIPTTMPGRLDHKSTCNDLRSSCCYCTNCVDHSASRSVEFGPCGSLKNTYFKSSTFVRAKQAFFKRPKASLTTK